MLGMHPHPSSKTLCKLSSADPKSLSGGGKEGEEGREWKRERRGGERGERLEALFTSWSHQCAQRREPCFKSGVIVRPDSKEVK